MLNVDEIRVDELIGVGVSGDGLLHRAFGGRAQQSDTGLAQET